MKTYDIDLEMQVVKSAIVSPKRMTLLRRLGGKNLFHYSGARELYERASGILRNQGEVPTWRELATDPAVSETVRDRAVDFKSKPVKKSVQFKRYAERLNEYARLRVGATVAKDIANLLADDKANPDDLSALLAKAAQNSRRITKDEMHRHIGLAGKKPSRTGEMVVADLLKSGAFKFVPTGFKAYDNQNRGFPRGAFVNLAGQTGGGKTTLADTMRVNQAKRGFSTNFWSLEMGQDENELRLISRISGIEMSKLLFPEKLSSQEKNKITKAYDKYVNSILATGGFTSVSVPSSDITIRELLDEAEPFGYDIIFIDYMTLLADADDPEQWKALGRAGRYAKQWAEKNNSIVVMLAQLSAEEEIRYAKAIKEHADNMWKWTYGEREAITHVINVKQDKARRGKMFTFQLKEDFNHSLFRDLTREELEEYERTQTNQRNKNNIRDYRRLRG